mmetsp:Transcript_78943/g.228196  ORF Transcript_78943/g.228196 Transcript_78943/m.228196 type:complete len:243 (-) Transcript_78943:12-740(-)
MLDDDDLDAQGGGTLEGEALAGQARADEDQGGAARKASPQRLSLLGARCDQLLGNLRHHLARGRRHEAHALRRRHRRRKAAWAAQDLLHLEARALAGAAACRRRQARAVSVELHGQGALRSVQCLELVHNKVELKRHRGAGRGKMVPWRRRCPRCGRRGQESALVRPFQRHCLLYRGHLMQGHLVVGLHLRPRGPPEHAREATAAGGCRRRHGWFSGRLDGRDVGGRSGRGTSWERRQILTL